MTSTPGAVLKKSDAIVAKNYLAEEELKALNLMVSAYLDFAELQALNRRPMTMAAWVAKLDDFIRMTERQILTHCGKVSHEDAVRKAEGEWAKYKAALPQAVDAHFAAAVDELKEIGATMKKKRSRKPKAGGAQE